MALMLSSRGILGRARELGQRSVPVRTGVVGASAAAVGLIAGRRRDAKTTPIIAVGIGAAANFAGLHAIGDGLMSGGATLIGYKWGAPKRPPAVAMPAPVVRRKRRGLFG